MEILSAIRPNTPLGLSIMAVMVASFLFAPLALFLLGTYSFGLVAAVALVKAGESLFGDTNGARQSA